jgi:integrase
MIALGSLMQRPKVRIYESARRGKKLWMVAVPKHGGGRDRKYFTVRAEAETYMNARQVEIRNHGTASQTIPEHLRLEAVKADELLRPYNRSLLDAAMFMVAHLSQIEASRTVKDIIPDFLAARRADGCSSRYLKDLKNRLARFEAKFGERLIAEISSVAIDDWLRSLGVAPLTRNTFRLRLNALFEYAVDRKWCGENPVASVDKAKVRPGEVGILTPEEFARLLENASEETLPYWAIGGFAGLRSAELERIAWEDVHFDTDLVEVKAAKSKTGARRFIKMQPSLKSWLAPYAGKRGLVVPRMLRKRLEADRAHAGITEWPSNALRHSFGSYHAAEFQHAGILAAEMGHRDPDTTYRHYRALVRPAIAHRYWSIMPQEQLKVVALSASA